MRLTGDRQSHVRPQVQLEYNIPVRLTDAGSTVRRRHLISAWDETVAKPGTRSGTSLPSFRAALPWLFCRTSSSTEPRGRSP